MARPSATRVRVEGATARDAARFSELMELYVEELSAVFPHVERGADGRYGYPELASYLAGGNGRWAFLIHSEGGVAGFVLARRGSPVTDDPNVLDVAEFFVLREFRGRGVGRAAAALLWDEMPGSWTVRAAERNDSAVRFWREVVAAYAGSRAKEFERTLGGSNWSVFRFDNSSG